MGLWARLSINSARIRRLLLFLAIILLAMILGMIGTSRLISGLHLYEYSATSMVYITKQATAETSTSGIYQDLLANKEVATDFANFISSEAGFLKVREHLGAQLPWLERHRFDADDHFISATNEAQSRLIKIEVVCDNPYDAAIIANGCVDILDELSMSVYLADYVQTVQIAEPDPVPSFPERRMLLPMGLGIGFAIGFAIVLAIWAAGSGRSLHAPERRGGGGGGRGGSGGDRGGDRGGSGGSIGPGGPGGPGADSMVKPRGSWFEG